VVRDYELMYIVRPELDDDALRASTESVESIIRGLGGTISKTTMWGKRRLAYEVDRLRDGHYVIALIQLDGARVTELERALQIHDTVFRHLIVRRDETAPLPEGAEGEVQAGDVIPDAGVVGLPGEDDDAVVDEEDIPEAEIAEEVEE